MKVRIKDRKKEIEYLRMALNLCEIGVDYTHADLIIRVTKALKKMKGDFSLEDGVKVHHKWKEEWEKYFDEESEKEVHEKNS